MVTLEQLLLKWNKLIEAYKNKTSISAGCSKCKRGFVKIPKNAPDIGWSSKACECIIEAEFLRTVLYLLEKSNLPLKYLKNNPLNLIHRSKLTLSDGGDLDAKTLKGYSEIIEEKNWIYLFGKVGTGKTNTAIALAQLYLLQEQSVYFANLAKLLEDLRPDSENKTVTMQKVLTSKVLILDDIGKEKMSEWVSERLFIIINERYAWDRKTILTSNVSLEELFKKTNYPLYSRIMGQAILLELVGKDKRL